MAKELSRSPKVSNGRGGTAEAGPTGQNNVQTRRININEIIVGPRMREIDEGAVDVLSASMAEIGLKTSISVRVVPSVSVIENDKKKSEATWTLVAGAHRLAAAKKLGWKTILCMAVAADDVEAKLWELAENLHRAELTVQQRADHVAAYVRLREERGRVSSQPETKPLGGRPRGGLRAAARELGIDKSEVVRAVKIASISDEARSAANAAKLDDNQSALLEIASVPTREEQLAKVGEIANRRGGRRTSNKAAVTPRSGSNSKAKPVPGSGAVAESSAGAVREAAFASLVALLLRRLGKEGPRFVRLSQDAGSNDLLRLAAAIEQKLVKHGNSAADALAKRVDKNVAFAARDLLGRLD